jgi:hypothetical protein
LDSVIEEDGMADRRTLLDTLRTELSTISTKLRTCTSLARCKEGARREFLAKEFLKKFEGVPLNDFDELLYDWLTGDRPDPRSVQTVLQVLIESGNETCIDTVLDCIDARVGGSFASTSQSPSKMENALRDAWWGDTILEPFEKSFPKKANLRKRVNTLIQEFRNHTQKAHEQPAS